MISFQDQDFEQEEEEEEEEDDYDEEDEEENYSSKKSKKKPRHGGFILDEAEVDDEVEDEEDFGNEGDVTVRREDVLSFEDDISSKRRLEKRTVGDESAFIQKLEAKYMHSQDQPYQDEEEGELPDDIVQQAALPSQRDANLWMIKCRIGEEKATVLHIMRKFIAYSTSDDPLLIKSVMAPEGIKGYIYIEAFKQTHVKQAIDGIGNLKMGVYKQTMVPFNEMTDVLKVSKGQTTLKRGQWVRIKRGLYKDDLAKVERVDTAQGTVELRLIPRIDYTRKRGALKTADTEPVKRKRAKRPPPKFFDREAVKAIGGEVSQDGDYMLFERDRYIRGFLYKDFPVQSLIINGVKPTLGELEKFEEEPDNVELAESTITDEETHGIVSGDNVIVIEGELVHLQGKVISVDGSKITMMPQTEGLKDALEFQAHELTKYFKVGDHVKVIAGRYEGDTGLVLRVLENHIVVFSDLTMHEIKVLAKDLQLSPDMATGVDSLGQYQWGDLVMLDNTTAGVIVRLEKENFQVLNMHGKLVHVKHQAVKEKKDNKRAVSLDSQQSQIQVKDHVEVISGPHADRRGEIRHLFRNWAFIHDRHYMENGGIFVAKTRDLRLSGGSKSVNAPGANRPGFLPYMSPRISSPMHPSGGRQPFGSLKGGRDRGDLELIGKTIKIIQGPYKGHIGIVKDAIGTTARVELHSQCQTITVDKQRIDIVERAPGERTGGLSHYARTPMYGGQTPSYEFGNRTPARGGMTPLHDGSRTPMHGSSSVWDPNTGATPRPNFEDDSWNADSSAAAGGSGYLNPPTPGYAAPDTPNAAPFATPQTPGMYASSDHTYSPYQPVPSPSEASYQDSAASPGSNYMTPSPAGYSSSGMAPSPSFGYSPMTPGAPSPMFNPQTPGAGMDNLNVEWQTTDIWVRIKEGPDSDLTGQIGIITGINGGMISVFLSREDRVINCFPHQLEPVVPEPRDRVSFLKVFFCNLKVIKFLST